MLSFKQYLTESKKMEWNSYPHIGWWKDKDHIVMYHGTHEKHIDSVLKNGINRKDPETGMISMAFEPNTAHGYAAMSGVGGETNFRKVGAKVKSTPEHERAVFVAHIPMEWAKKHMDPKLGGNLSQQRKNIESKEEYEKHIKSGGEDYAHYQMAELRFKEPIPPHFIKGYMKKK